MPCKNFGEHGRELITNEVALQLLQLLAHDDKLAAFCQRQGIPLQPLLAALMHTVIKVHHYMQPETHHLINHAGGKSRRAVNPSAAPMG